MSDDAIPAGMKPWAGGDHAPADWDGGPVLFRMGRLSNKGEGPVSDASGKWIEGHGNWRHDNGWDDDRKATVPGKYDVIAYTPAVTGSDERAREVRTILIRAGMHEDANSKTQLIPYSIAARAVAAALAGAGEVERLRAEVAYLTGVSGGMGSSDYRAADVDAAVLRCRASGDDATAEVIGRMRLAYAALATPPVDEAQWRSMDNAPKDGTHVLAWFWSALADRNYGWADTVRWWNGMWWDDRDGPCQPAAWMVRPAPPARNLTGDGAGA